MRNGYSCFPFVDLRKMIIRLVLLLSFSFVGHTSTDWCDISSTGCNFEHTMCVYKHTVLGEACKGVNFTTKLMTPQVRENLLFIFNLLRHRVARGGQPGLPKAGNMQQLKWNNELEIFAQRWANQCITDHGPEAWQTTPLDYCRDLENYPVAQWAARLTGKSDINILQVAIEHTLTLYDSPPEFYEKILENGYSPRARGGPILFGATFSYIGCGFSTFTYNGSVRASHLYCNMAPLSLQLTDRYYSPGPPCSQCASGYACRSGDVFSALCQRAKGLRLVEIQTDNFAYIGVTTVLNCRYEMNGDTLYSVKWYKDYLEFFRFVPMDDPPVQTFPVFDQFTVDLTRSNQSQVAITPRNISATGVYRCEVSAEAPSFETVSGEETLTVVVLPKSDPAIEGGRPLYREGEHVKLLCKSDPSHPPARLTWYINGMKVNNSLLRGPSIMAVSNGLQVTSLGLEFQTEKTHFASGQLKLTCLASIDSIYLKSNEETIESTDSSPTMTDVSNGETKDKFVSPHFSIHGDPYGSNARLRLVNYWAIFSSTILLFVLA